VDYPANIMLVPPCDRTVYARDSSVYKVVVVNGAPVAVIQLTPVMVFELSYDKWIVITQRDVLCENCVMHLDTIYRIFR